MNKYQKALDNLVEKALCWIEDRALTTHMAKRQAEAITKREALLQDLVDKATPKKAIVEKGWYYKNFRCPCCMNLVAEKMYVYSENELTIQNYCSACGQALKWSDEE